MSGEPEVAVTAVRDLVHDLLQWRMAQHGTGIGAAGDLEQVTPAGGNRVVVTLVDGTKIAGEFAAVLGEGSG